MTTTPKQPSRTPTAEMLQKKRPPRTSNRSIVIVSVAGLIAVGGIAFAAGRLTAPALPAGFPGGPQNGGGAGFQPPAGGGPPDGGGFGGGAPGGFFGGGLTGTITSIDGDTLTLETEDGGTITVNLNGGTTYAEEVDAAQSDLDEGDEVRIGIDVGGGFDPGSEEVDASSVTLVEP